MISRSTFLSMVYACSGEILCKRLVCSQTRVGEEETTERRNDIGPGEANAQPTRTPPFGNSARYQTNRKDQPQIPHRTYPVSALDELDGHFLAGALAPHELGLTKIARANVSHLRQNERTRKEMKAWIKYARQLPAIGLSTPGTTRDQGSERERVSRGQITRPPQGIHGRD